ncbi:DUF2946 domain-containing protein [Pseudomonas sp. DTU_2021_1001937_2_SI_NGA_ILE_001]|uniref:DUF2946 domain-containing protein n=1 Tax=Pseudomonas sp. DTU_2021_1001937_2_SI_NGA_ILE_001 TaxID=3077589 RepID=UPI0028FC2C3A|nr:DUF2946 domain-containing protein [Pseudomonas sp. DTU_2021_1001937_2_SI_NGA_ILE_001]WNW13167.1 DUF2946 domain-containing protein [Pseudomonas sp. DTU_2021_1001937_2_SI_NGA_ILE_001]
MSARRTTTAWIACFALLFSLLAMPLAPNAPRGVDVSLLLGGFCGANAQLAALSLGDHGQPQKDPHSGMQHCLCCSGGLTVMLPAGLPAGLFAWQPPVRLPAYLLPTPQAPHLQWPAANPRASPHV